VAGESGSGKSETATAIAGALAAQGIDSVIFQQDDYFVYPPKSNDRARRNDITWVGPQEVKIDLLDQHLKAFRNGAASIDKPLVDYETDSITAEELATAGARVAIAEGTYTSLLENVDARVFIARNYEQTRAHREKRKRDAAELDPFLDTVLRIEHGIISEHLARADIVIDADYSVTVQR
jgi:uridine kinase